MASLGRMVICSMAAMLVVGSTAAQVNKEWREAFQSSPASYEPLSEEMIRHAAKEMKLPLEKLRENLTPRPLSGTVRYRVSVTAPGAKIRIRLSNEEGRTPLGISAATVGLAGEGFSARPGSLKPVTVGGAASLTISAGSPVLSDPVELPVSAGTELIVSVALASPLMNDLRGGAMVSVAAGNQTGRETVEGGTQMPGRPLVSGIAVWSAPAPRVIVTMGDSITDGNRAEPSQLHGWPEQLSRRLSATTPSAPFAVVNAGIAGNRLLAPGWGPAGLARLDRDVLRIEGVSHLVLLEGINDIGMSGQGLFGSNPEVHPADLIAGYRQVIARAHARGIKVIIGTLTPTGGSLTHSSPSKDRTREAVNQWIRTSGEPDAVIDFDKILRDPSSPASLGKEYDSGDHLHPSDAGYRAMGDAIDLAVFR